ncbi:MAG: hypothetical protein WBQ21_00390 [Solirubrobacteraceae bacterium]
MPLVETGSTASNSFPIVNHVVVSSSDVLSGLIGGAVVLLGVILTEAFVRLRERRRRLNDAAWTLQTAMGGGLATGRVPSMSNLELLNRYQMFMQELGRIRTDAKWPIRNAKQIVAEVDSITIRFMVSLARWAQNEAEVPRLGPILGSVLLPLIFREARSSLSLDEALKREGLPSLGEATADESHNAQPTNKRS